MEWIDIASIVFVCVTMNHLGLIGVIEERIGYELPIINCSKCSSYWSVFAFTLVTAHDIIPSLAVSFLASYTAIWLELLEAYIDTLYLWLYGKITSTDNDDTASDGTDGYDAAGPVSGLQEDCEKSN